MTLTFGAGPFARPLMRECSVRPVLARFNFSCSRPPLDLLEGEGRRERRRRCCRVGCRVKSYGGNYRLQLRLGTRL